MPVKSHSYSKLGTDTVNTGRENGFIIAGKFKKSAKEPFSTQDFGPAGIPDMFIN